MSAHEASRGGGAHGRFTVIEDFKIFRHAVLGQGQFGTVVRGERISDQVPVAVKIMTVSTRILARVLREVTELFKLQEDRHPNVIKLYNQYMRDERDKCIVIIMMELCEGGDLREYIRDHGGLHEHHARRIMAQIVDCVSSVHRKHVMHRDLKPENILLTSKDIDVAEVRLADWGMARSLTGASTVGDDQHMFKSSLGTPAYMAPERLEKERYDFKAEVWAVGIIMYELLFATHPYPSVRSQQELLRSIRGPLRIPAQDPPLTPACVSLLQQLLHAHPKERPTMDEVRASPWFAGCFRNDAAGGEGSAPAATPGDEPRGLPRVGTVDGLASPGVGEGAFKDCVSAPPSPTTDPREDVQSSVTRRERQVSFSPPLHSSTPGQALAGGKVGMPTPSLSPELTFAVSPTTVHEVSGNRMVHGVSRVVYDVVRDFVLVVLWAAKEEQASMPRRAVLLHYAAELVIHAARFVAGNTTQCCARHYLDHGAYVQAMAQLGDHEAVGMTTSPDGPRRVAGPPDGVRDQTAKGTEPPTASSGAEDPANHGETASGTAESMSGTARSTSEAGRTAREDMSDLLAIVVDAAQRCSDRIEADAVEARSSRRGEGTIIPWDGESDVPMVGAPANAGGAPESDSDMAHAGRKSLAKRPSGYFAFSSVSCDRGGGDGVLAGEESVCSDEERSGEHLGRSDGDRDAARAPAGPIGGSRRGTQVTPAGTGAGCCSDGAPERACRALPEPTAVATAQVLLFEHALRLIRTAAQEELLEGSDVLKRNTVTGALPPAMVSYERALALLLVLLQRHRLLEAVMSRPVACTAGDDGGHDSDAPRQYIQLLPIEDEVDRAVITRVYRTTKSHFKKCLKRG